jgi:hypothetical protein
MKKFWIVFLLPLFGHAQFAPPAGQAGSTAMSKDSSAFINWASSCRLTRGWEDISNAASGYPTVGDSSSAIGVADNSIVSLGDGGFAICTFQHPLTNGAGYDFAVFENSFSDDYLEFGFVEVSSDGISFFRFPATCNIEDTVQTSSFGTCDASLVNNLAGKYRALYGTPFDLQELAGTPGLNIDNVTHIKIVDVVGSINPAYATYDKNNHNVNDPWPTPFASSGFDLDAVGVIHDITNSIAQADEASLNLFPNPATTGTEVKLISSLMINRVFVTDVQGKRMSSACERTGSVIKLNTKDMMPGVFFVHVVTSAGTLSKKLIISQ